MDGGAWWATVHGVTKSRTRLSNFTFTFIKVNEHFCYLDLGKKIHGMHFLAKTTTGISIIMFFFFTHSYT